MVLVVLTTRCCVVTSLSNIFAEVEKLIQRQNNVPTDEKCNRVTNPRKARSHDEENPRTVANSFQSCTVPLQSIFSIDIKIFKTDNHDQARTHLL